MAAPRKGPVPDADKATDERVRAVLAEVTAGWVAELAPVTAGLLGVPAGGKRARAAAETLLAYLHGAVLTAKVANEPAVISVLGRSAEGLLAGGPRFGRHTRSIPESA